MSSPYGDTLNLPNTKFPMKADLARREPTILARWQTLNLYQQLMAQGKAEGRPRFILHDGPPYANGNIHIGHAVNKTLKDIVIKSKTLSGFYAPYVPGWDCHGLPIELNVEKKIGKAGDKVSISEFRKACRDYARGQLDKQRDAFKRLGVLGDWDHPYTTMDNHFEANVVRALARIIANGFVQPGYKPVHWCMACRSALAEAEVEYKDKESSAIDVVFAVVDRKQFVAALGEGINAADKERLANPAVTLGVPIWTTTPWTLPANQAVALHPTITYRLVACGNDDYLLIAEPLVDAALQRYGISNATIIADCSGSAFENIRLQHPFVERLVPIILGTHVTTDAGTGAVHTAPAHGQEDYVAAQSYNLPVDNPVDARGCFITSAPVFAGEHVFKANDPIIDLLKARGVLRCVQKLVHSYPHCWRHKTPLIFRATPQWFVSMDTNALREKVMDAIEQTQWLPAWGKARIADMIEQRPDWCISRQRSWGTPMTLWIHRETGALHPRTLEWMELIAQRIEKDGLDAWDTLAPEAQLDEKDRHDYEKVTDSLDVWFDSGVTHACVLEPHPELSVPADLYLEGSDQHRGWFQSSLITAVAMYGHAPYKAVLTHGFTVDERGHKMSKSLGNVIAPEKVINRLGADVLRLWVASADYRNEMSVSDEILKRTSDAYRRLRNTLRFLLANLHDFDPSAHSVPPEQQLALDRWAIDAAFIVQEAIKEDYDTYQFHQICRKVLHFCTVAMGGFYLDLIKDRQYTEQTDSLARRSAQTTMYHILEALVRWIAPILSFTAEEVWQYLPGDKRPDSVFLTTWYDKLTPLLEKVDAGLTRDDWTQLIAVRDAVNQLLESLRADGNIGAGLDATVRLFCEPPLANLLKCFGDELHFLFITSGADVVSATERGDDAVPTSIEGLWLNVRASDDKKCERCWHREPSVGQHTAHAMLCSRCVTNIEGRQQNAERKFI